MKKLLFLFFTLTVSSYTYSQVTSFNNLVSKVLIFDLDNHQNIDNALTVPEGTFWYIQFGVVNFELGEISGVLGTGEVLPEGTKLWRTAGILNIIEYNLGSDTTLLGTNDIKLNNKMQLFPNPTNSRLSLNSEKDYNIEVFDLTGRKIMEAQGNNLDMSNLSKATYIVKAFDKASKETYSYKVIRN